MRTKPRHLPMRLATGAFIFNEGVMKLSADDETAKRLHSMAAGAYPFLADMDHRLFTKLLSAAELTLGTALLLPLVPSRMAALGLGAFSGGLMGLYARTPGMRQTGSIRPTEDGLMVAKDIWMVGIAISMLTDRGHKKAKS